MSGAPNLREIVLCTQAEQTTLHELWLQLGQLRIDLMLRDIALKVKCSGTMHDREIRLYFHPVRGGTTTSQFLLNAEKVVLFIGYVMATSTFSLNVSSHINYGCHDFF